MQLLRCRCRQAFWPWHRVAQLMPATLQAHCSHLPPGVCSCPSAEGSCLLQGGRQMGITCTCISVDSTQEISVWPKIIMNVCSCRTLSFAEWERRSMRVALPALLHGHYSLERGSCQTWYGERSCSSSCSVCSCGRVPILVCLRQQAVLEFLLGSRWQKVGRIRTAWLCDQLGFC